MGDIAIRTALMAIGALFLHNAVWWNSSWFLGMFYNSWWHRQSQLSQGIYRTWNAAWGSLLIVVALFAGKG
jgi:hypothetical protein